MTILNLQGVETDIAGMKLVTMMAKQITRIREGVKPCSVCGSKEYYIDAETTYLAEPFYIRCMNDNCINARWQLLDDWQEAG